MGYMYLTRPLLILSSDFDIIVMSVFHLSVSYYFQPFVKQLYLNVSPQTARVFDNPLI